MPQVKNILLVCTGNSCRSVMAAGLLKKILEGEDDYKITTAGIAAVKGVRPTFETIQVMAEQNIIVSNHLSQILSDEMTDEADLILVMERRHKEDILSRSPKTKDKLYLLSEYGRLEKEDRLVDPDIPDPIGKSLDFYRKILGIIKESVERAAKKILEE